MTPTASACAMPQHVTETLEADSTQRLPTHP